MKSRANPGSTYRDSVQVHWAVQRSWYQNLEREYWITVKLVYKNRTHMLARGHISAQVSKCTLVRLRSGYQHLDWQLAGPPHSQDYNNNTCANKTQFLSGGNHL